MISFGLVHRALSKLPPSFQFHALFLKLGTQRVGEQPQYLVFLHCRECLLIVLKKPFKINPVIVPPTIATTRVTAKAASCIAPCFPAFLNWNAFEWFFSSPTNGNISFSLRMYKISYVVVEIEL